MVPVFCSESLSVNSDFAWNEVFPHALSQHQGWFQIKFLVSKLSPLGQSFVTIAQETLNLINKVTQRRNGGV